MSEVDNKTRSLTLRYYPLTALCAVLCAYLLHSCAVVRTPTGGDKDLTAPAIVRTFPEAGARNYKGNILSIEANEDIVLNDLNKQLLISPRFDGSLTPKIKGKRIVFKVNGKLLPNTTYTFSFRKAIVDITESNPASNPQIIFSTGPDLDTNTIRVELFHVETGKPKPNVLVGLIDKSQLDSFNLFKVKPDYFAYSDSSGVARLNFLPAKSYKLLAWTDNNDNLKYDDKAEALGWVDTLVPALAIAKALTVPISFHDSKAPIRLSTTAYKRACELTFSEGIASIRVDKATAGLNLLPLKDKILFTHKTLDSLPIILSYKDSTGNTTQDTLTLRFDEPKKQHPQLRKPFYEKQDRISMEANQTVVWKLRDSSILVNPSEITVFKDSTTDKITSYQLTKKQTELQLKGLPIGKYRIIITKRALQDFRDSGLKKIDTAWCTITAAKDENYGTISTTTAESITNGLINLTNERGSYQEQQPWQNKNTFKNLNPSSYFLKAYIDLDGNSNWSGANYLKQQRPEPLYIYPNAIPLKANWEVTDIQLQKPR